MLAFARVALLRLVRDRTNVFFIVLFPLLVVMLIGVQFSGGGAITVALVGGDGPVRTALVEQLTEADVELEDLDTEASARRAVEEGDVDAAVVLPDGPVDAGAGTATVGFIANPDGSDLATRALVQAAVEEVDGSLRAQRALVDAGVVGGVDAAAALVEAVGPVGPEVSTSLLGGGGLASEFAGLGQFDIGASSQVLLFVFITAITSSAGIVQVRRWGVLDRVLTGPTAPASVIAGLGLGQLAVAGLQALVIVVATSLLFDVNWGDPLATGAVLLAFCLVAAAAGLLIGSLLRSEEQAAGIGVPLSIGLAALGGSMVPLEIFPEGLQRASWIAPHAWGNRAFAEIVRRDGGLVDVLGYIGGLVGFALLFGAVAALLLRRRLAVEA